MHNAKTNPESFFSNYINHCEKIDLAGNIGSSNTRISGHLETRSRKMDLTEALRFRVHDPLWMLSRQWQLGEFRGNDAGTAMSVRCHVATTPISGYQIGNTSAGKVSGLSNTTPIEPIVEQINRAITPLVRVESAAYYCKLISGLPPRVYDATVGQLKKNYPLQNLADTGRGSLEHDEIRSFSDSRNIRLQRFARAFSAKAFDGYALYQDLSKSLPSRGGTSLSKSELEVLEKARETYLKWFANRYLPKSQGAASAWNQPELGYDFEADNAVAKYKSQDYVGGRVSWYSFDVDSMKDSADSLQRGDYKRKNVDRTTIDSLPVLASYPGAPNKRLWQFENRDVFMGNSREMQAKGNVAFMQFATMYGNDWMLCPLKTEIGKYVEVESIEVYDTFGCRNVITTRAGMDDVGPETFGQRWQMFTNTPVDVRTFDGLKKTAQKHFANGLMFPPALVRTLEGEPLEEVNLLRDEMANMVWGVETRIEDGCGSSLDAKQLAADVGQYLEDEYDKKVAETREKVSAMSVTNVQVDDKTVTEVESGYKSDYKYSLMTSVPLNWIPFVPQHLNSKAERAKYEGFQGGRETILRRGKMPYFFDGEYRPVRPLSSILKVETSLSRKQVMVEKPLSSLVTQLNQREMSSEGADIQLTRKDKVGKVTQAESDMLVIEKPLFINEEQVQGVGTVIRKNCQRSRWLDGRTFTWMGYSKEIKHTQGVSGLEFDNLLQPTR